MGFGIPEFKTDAASFLKMPLAGCTLSIDFAICTFAAYKILGTLLDDDDSDGNHDFGNLDVGDWIMIVVYTAQVLLSFVAMIALLKRWESGSRFITAGYNIVIGNLLVDIISDWLLWILDLSGATTADRKPWKPDGIEITLMVLQVLGVTFLFYMSWWVFSILKSTQAVLAAGGSGWEFRSADEVKEYMRERIYKSSKSFDSAATSID